VIFVERNLHPVVAEAEFKRLLRLPPDYVFADRMAENAHWVREWYAEHGRPWLCARHVTGCEVTAEAVTLGGRRLHSRELARRFRAAGSALVVGACAGVEAETEAARQWEIDEPDRYYFLETYASAVVEALIAEARGRLCAWADQRDEVLLPHYSPGYHGWSVGDQGAVHALLTEAGPLPATLEVMSSGMLRPKKSQLAVFAVAADGAATGEPADLVPCKYCAHVRCEFRREAYAVA